MGTERKLSFNWNIYRCSKRDVELAKKDSRKKSIVDKGERDPLKELSEPRDVLKTNANKGGTVVTWETQDYISEANQQSNITSNYKKIPNGSTLTHSKLINDIIDRFKHEQLIPKERAESLKRNDPEAWEFHVLPKYVKSTTLEDQLLVL